MPRPRYARLTPCLQKSLVEKTQPRIQTKRALVTYKLGCRIVEELKSKTL